MKDRYFWDSNLWIYLFINSSDPDDIRKKTRLREMLRLRPDLVSSAQVLNEVGNALLRKYRFSETDVRDFLQKILILTDNRPLSAELSMKALDLKARYQFGWYDSIIIASALESGCSMVFSEDLNHGMVVEGKLTIKNPFL